MKATSFVLLWLLSMGLVQGQQLKQNLQADWVLTNITTADGSKVYHPDLEHLTLEYTIKSNDSLRLTLDGKSMWYTYQVADSTLRYGLAVLQIKELSASKLVVAQTIALAEEPTEVRLVLHRKQVATLGRQPQFYTARNGQRVYIAADALLYPYFMDEEKNAMSTIYQHFKFPEWKKGKFAVRFIVTQQNKLTSVRVVESSHPKYNAALLAAVDKTKYKWQAAEWEGRPVNAEVVLYFDLDFPTQATISPIEQYYEAQYLVEEGNAYLKQNRHRLALASYTMAISVDDKFVEAYKQRAAVYLRQKDVPKACGDWQKLIELDQNWAIKLFKEHRCSTPR